MHRFADHDHEEEDHSHTGLWWVPLPGRHVHTHLQEILQLEASAGLVIFLATVVALLWVNTFTGLYHDIWEHHITLGIDPIEVELTVEEWVNDALMVIFFFVVSLEIKRELVHGELNDPRAASLPVIAAVGGMAVPAAIFAALNVGTDAGKGWGIPVATDIAFTIGVLAVLGRRIPSGLRLFILTVAIADDIGGILVIAVFYTADLDIVWLLVAGGAVLGIQVLQRLGVFWVVTYIVAGVVLWYATFESGVHATIAGVMLGLLTPARQFRGRQVLDPLEDTLAPWSAFVVVPIFALANAGIEITGDSLEAAFTDRLAWGVALGLVLGKTVGISLAAFAALALGVGRLPSGLGPRHVFGGAMLAGIGFTVSIFIATLSFPEHPELLDEAKMGVLAGSLAAGVIGATFLTLVGRESEEEEEPEGPEEAVVGSPGAG